MLTLRATKQAWGPRQAPLFESGRMSYRARDFLSPWEPLPSGETPSVFLVRLILHDWQDNEARR